MPRWCPTGGRPGTAPARAHHEGWLPAPATGNDLDSAPGGTRFEPGRSAPAGDAADVRPLGVDDGEPAQRSVGPLDPDPLRRGAVRRRVRGPHDRARAVADDVARGDVVRTHRGPLLLAEQLVRRLGVTL